MKIEEPSILVAGKVLLAIAWDRRLRASRSQLVTSLMHSLCCAAVPLSISTSSSLPLNEKSCRGSQPLLRCGRFDDSARLLAVELL